MNTVSSWTHLAASCAFGQIAERYDETFTRTTIGKAQRGAVWATLTRAFSAGDHILELNCGTGEDALFLAHSGVQVTAYDASPEMVAVARRRKVLEAPDSNLEFRVLANENLNELRGRRNFDGALSNFSGLNCVADLRGVAANLGSLLRVGARALICVSTRVCLWEMCWYLSHANVSKAFRRTRGQAVAHLQGLAVPVWYPTIGGIRNTFNPWFSLRSVRAVGLFVPPSYLEAWARRHGPLIAILARMDRVFARCPVLRGVGDHVLLEFERTRL